MTVRGTVELPFQNGVITVGKGVVTIKQSGMTTQRMPLITVYAYAQPEPYYTLDDDPTRITTDGQRLLFHAAVEATEPVRAVGGYDLLADLLVSPQGLILPDLTPDVLMATRPSFGTQRNQRHTIKLDVDRCGLKKGSEIEFREGIIDCLTFEPLPTTGYDGDYR